MKTLLAAALSLPLAGAAFAQTTDVSSYTEAENIDVVGGDGETIGEVEATLLNDTGAPVAFVVEVNDGFLDLGDTDVVMQVDALSWDNGKFTTDMTAEDIENLPTWDD